jgi:hypothetical protein
LRCALVVGLLLLLAIRLRAFGFRAAAVILGARFGLIP